MDNALGVSVIATGFEDVDQRLAEFDRRTQNTFVRRALNDAIIFIQVVYERLVPVDSGAMRDATKRFTPKSKKRGEFQRALRIDRDRLFQLYAKRTGKKPGSRSKDTEPFFYPAVVELGDRDTPAQRPLRASLYGSEAQVKAVFIAELRAALAWAGSLKAR